MKFAIRVEEILGRTVIVNAENLDEAIEKAEEAAEDGTLLLDGIEDYCEREIKPSDVFGSVVVPEDRDVSYYEHLD